MVHFNELTITPDGKYLIIDVSVSSEYYYEDTLIVAIDVDTQDTFTDAYSPSSKAMSVYSSDGEKHITLALDKYELGLSPADNMFFVYVRTNGEAAPETPCGMDNMTTMGTVVNMYPFYQQSMNYIKELGSNCSVPQGFIDYILKMKGLGLAIDTGNYDTAIDYFNRFFKGKAIHMTEKGGCGCGNS